MFCVSVISAKTKNDDLIYLRNNDVEIGILPEVGGRIVICRLTGFDNILKSNEKLWSNSKK